MEKGQKDDYVPYITYWADRAEGQWSRSLCCCLNANDKLLECIKALSDENLRDEAFGVLQEVFKSKNVLGVTSPDVVFALVGSLQYEQCSALIGEILRALVEMGKCTGFSDFQRMLIDLLKSDISQVRTEVCSVLVRFPNTLEEDNCDYLISLLSDKRCMKEVCTILLKFARMKQFTSAQELYFIGLMDNVDCRVYVSAILSNISAVRQLYSKAENKLVGSLGDENCSGAVCSILARYNWKLSYESELSLVELLRSEKNSEVAKKILKDYVAHWLLDTRVEDRLRVLKMTGWRAAAEVLDEYEKCWPSI